MKRALLLIIVFSLIISPVLADEKNQDKDLVIGQQAPKFSLPDLESKYIFLSDFCGTKLRKPWINKTKHVVVISFFATWCGPCKREIPYLHKLRNEYKNRNIKFFLIDVGEDAEKVKSYTKTNPVEIPILLDRYNQTADKYGANTLPRLVVLDKNGLVQKYEKGFTDGDSFLTDMRHLLDELSVP